MQVAIFLLLGCLVSADSSDCNHWKNIYDSNDCCTNYVSGTCDGPRSSYQTTGCCTNPDATAPPTPTPALDPNLMHWWPMDEAIDATLAVDAAGAANLELKGGAVFLGPDSDSGGGVVLSNPNGNDGSFLDFGNGFAFAATNGFTFAAWVRMDSTQTSGRILDIRDDAVGDGNYIQLYNMGREAVKLYISNDGKRKSHGAGAAADVFFPDPGLWIHVAVTATAGDSSTYTLYRDGETHAGWAKRNRVAVNPSAMTYTFAALGRDDESESNYYDGALRDVRLYDRVLIASEVGALVQGQGP